MPIIEESVELQEINPGQVNMILINSNIQAKNVYNCPVLCV